MPNSTANVKQRKPRPKPVRPKKEKKATKKTLRGIESLASSAANNIMQRTLKEFQKIRNIAQYKGEGPAPETHSYGVMSDPSARNSSAREPSARKPRPKPVRRTKKQFNATTNPYSINMVMNNPQVKISSVRKSRARKPSARKGFSLNQVTFPDTQVPAQVPRIMTLNQLVRSNVSLNQAKANAQRNAQLFVSAFAKRKSAARKPRIPKGKAI